MTEIYDDLTWEIGETPVGFSTPDDLFEYSHRATTSCPHCGVEISGTAQIWSRNENMIGAWLERVDYEPCHCDEKEDEDAD